MLARRARDGRRTDPSDVATDGRLARSVGTRAAVADAMLALIEAGDLRPTAPRIAERAGVSLRSVFQHFPDLDTLFAAVADRQTERIRALLQRIPPQRPLAERLAAFVAQRVRVLEMIAPVRRAALLMAPVSPEIARRLEGARTIARTEVERVFARELAACDATARSEWLAALDVASGWSTWESLRTHHGLPVERAHRVVTRMLTTLLEGAGRSRPATHPKRRKHGNLAHAR